MQDAIDATGNDASGNTEYIDPAAIGGTNSDGQSTGTGSGIRDKFGTEFDPAIHASPDSRNRDGSFRGKRGRRAGSGSGTKSKAKIHSDIKASAEMLTKALMISHFTIAAMTKTPEMVLEQQEAEGLSESTLTLLELYDIKPDPKVEAAILLAGHVGLIYGSRIVAIRARKSNEKKGRREGTATVETSDGSTGTAPFTATDEWPVPPQGSGNLGSIN